MLLATFEAGPADTNGYLVADGHGGPAIAVDAPMGVAAAMANQAKAWGTTITLLINTHGHWDHFLDNASLVKLAGARFGIHRESAPLLTVPQTKMFGLNIDVEPVTPDFYLEEGRSLP